MNTTALYLVTVLIWGSSWLAIRYQIGIVAPEISLIYRFALATVLLVLWCVVRGISLRFRLRDHPYLALLGLCLFSMNYLLFYQAAFNLATGLLAVIFSTMTVMNIVNSTVLLGRKTEKQTILGACLGLTGMALVFWPQIQQTGTTTFAAVVISVIATYLASIGNILSARNQMHGLPVVSANAIGMAYGTCFLLIYSLWSDAPFAFDTAGSYIGSLAFLALFASAIAFGCYLTLVGRIGPEKAAYATVLFPIVALSLSTWVENFQWQGRAIAGVILVLGGNVIVLLGQTHFTALIRLLRR